jgi:hypothetical protein
VHKWNEARGVAGHCCTLSLAVGGADNHRALAGAARGALTHWCEGQRDSPVDVWQSVLDSLVESISEKWGVAGVGWIQHHQPRQRHVARESFAWKNASAAATVAPRGPLCALPCVLFDCDREGSTSAFDSPQVVEKVSPDNRGRDRGCEGAALGITGTLGR